jgi:magnesium-protoporphyrin IX monomethyl ester (oxidative) cyclase
MKVLLTVPPHCFRRSHPDIPDLGLGYLASALRRSGHEPSLLDWGRRDTAESAAALFRSVGPEAVGIKTFTKNFRAVGETIRLIRSLSGSVPIILGGPHASAEAPEKLFRDFPGADYAVRGEGEEILPRLITALEKGRDMPGLPGLVASPGRDTPPDAPCAVVEGETDRPAWDLLDPRAYTPVTIGRSRAGKTIVPMVGTRGCPHRCTFCAAPCTSGRRIRYRDRAAILDEMAHLAAHYDANQFVFVDMNFTHDEARLLDFCRALGGNPTDWAWNCVASPGFYGYASAALLRTMRDAGCTTLVMGVETASPRMRERVRKSPALEKISAVARWAGEAGIERRGYFMYGFPDESLEEMAETYRYAFSGLFDFLSFDLCFPLPGTEMLRDYLQQHRMDELSWETFTPGNPPAPISRAGGRALRSMLVKSRVRAMMRDRGLLKTSLAVLRKMSSRGKG